MSEFGQCKRRGNVKMQLTNASDSPRSNGLYPGDGVRKEEIDKRVAPQTPGSLVFMIQTMMSIRPNGIWRQIVMVFLVTYSMYNRFWVGNRFSRQIVLYSRYLYYYKIFFYQRNAYFLHLSAGLIIAVAVCVCVCANGASEWVWGCFLFIFLVKSVVPIQTLHTVGEWLEHQWSLMLQAVVKVGLA